jgi:hypothetical protein
LERSRWTQVEPALTQLKNPHALRAWRLRRPSSTSQTLVRIVMNTHICLHTHLRTMRSQPPLVALICMTPSARYLRRHCWLVARHVRACIDCRAPSWTPARRILDLLTPGCHLDVHDSLYLIPATSINQTPDPVLAVKIPSDETGSTNLIRRRRIIPHPAPGCKVWFRYLLRR